MVNHLSQVQSKPLNKRDALKHHLIQEIRSGRFRDGRLPSVRSLAADHNVSLVTANQALASLAQDGIVSRHVGRGTFISSDVKVDSCPLTQGQQLVMVVDSNHQQGYTDMIMVRAFSAHAMANGFVPVVLSIDKSDSTSTLKSLQRAAAGGGVGGLLIACNWDELPSELTDGILEATPCVFFGEPLHDKYPYVTADMATGLFQAVEHLHALAHRRVVVVGESGCTTEGMFNMAMGAVRSATQDLGGGQVVFDPVFLDGVDSLEAGLGSLFSDKCPPTAIVCLSWTLLSGIRGLLHQMELSVPGDVSLIGYGQSAGHLNLVPSLTCIEASKEHETLAAINLLTEMLPHKDRYAPKLSFPTWLVTRQSTSRAKSGGR